MADVTYGSFGGTIVAAEVELEGVGLPVDKGYHGKEARFGATAGALSSAEVQREPIPVLTAFDNKDIDVETAPAAGRPVGNGSEVFFTGGAPINRQP